MSDLLKPCTPPRALHSAFHYAPLLWNNLTADIRQSNSIDSIERVVFPLNCQPVLDQGGIVGFLTL